MRSLISNLIACYLPFAFLLRKRNGRKCNAAFIRVLMTEMHSVSKGLKEKWWVTFTAVVTYKMGNLKRVKPRNLHYISRIKLLIHSWTVNNKCFTEGCNLNETFRIFCWTRYVLEFKYRRRCCGGNGRKPDDLNKTREVKNKTRQRSNFNKQ